MFSEDTVEESPSPDPWPQTGRTTVPLGASAWLAMGAAEPVVTGTAMLTVGFSLLDLQPPSPLTATARLEGELVKLTGSYTPPGGGGAPTDFQAYVGEGQAFILQTEDAPVVLPALGSVGGRGAPRRCRGSRAGFGSGSSPPGGRRRARVGFRPAMPSGRSAVAGFSAAKTWSPKMFGLGPAPPRRRLHPPFTAW